MEPSLFAGARVRDFAQAHAWYERLLGETAFMPHETEAVWELGENRFVYVVEDAERAGGAIVTVFVGDLDETLASISGRGLEPDDHETYSNGVRKAIYRDSDGNEIGFGGGPETDPA